jgi:hypothetical protein
MPRRAAVTTTDTSLDWMISVDDHVIEPPGVWQDRVPAKYKDSAPRMVEEGDDEYWVYENRRVATSGLSATAGKKTKDFSPEPVRYRDAGAVSRHQRLRRVRRVRSAERDSGRRAGAVGHGAVVGRAAG